MSDSVEAAIQRAAASATAAGPAAPIVIKEDRSIVVPTAMQQIAVQCDNEANVLHFVCPRNWADIDLAAATLYINVVKPDKSTVAFVCTNVVSSEDTITFDWVVTEPVTDVVGKLSFLVCARDPSDPGNGYRWHSNLCDSLFIAPGIACVVPSDTPDPPHIPLYGTDTTLTKPHVPADAAAVGEQLNSLSEKVANLPQADWNQNDSTAANYVKNRPFYTGDPVETVVVEETTVQFVGEGGLYLARVPSTFEATVGETYKVSWDGTVYECTCVAFGKVLVLGNLSIPGAGSDTGEPFVMAIVPNLGTEIYTADTSASHTFSIRKTVVPVVKIDKKYLVQPDWNQNDENAADFVKNRPFYAASLVSVRNPGIPEAFWYNVSDAVPTGDYSVGAPCSLVANGEKRNGEIFLSTDDYYAVKEGLVFVALKDNVKVEGITFPKKGTYFAYVSGNPVITGFALGADADSEITWDGRTEKELKKLDAKYLPDTLATKSEVGAAQTAAVNAQTAAVNAQTAADKSKETLSELFTSVATFTFDKQTSGRDTFVFNAFNYYKISDFNPAPDDVISFTGTRESGDKWSKITIGNNCVHYGFFIVVASAGACSLPVTETVTSSFTAPSAGLYAQYNEGNTTTTAGTGKFILRGSTESLPITGLLLKSSTDGSTKKFQITVTDRGAISVTEVV